MSFILNTLKSADVHKIDAVKWENCNIVGIETNWWDKSDHKASLYEKKVIAEAKLITGIFKKDFELVKEAVETGLINILNGISIITDDLENPNDIFEITEAKKYSSPEIIKYLTKVYNDKSQKSYMFLPNIVVSETRIKKTKAFEGEQAVIVPESKIRYIDDNYINFDGTKIIGVVKYSDEYGVKSGEEILAKGVIEGNFGLVKVAIEKYNIDPRQNISLVTNNKNELCLNTLYEAKKRNYSDIVNYLQDVVSNTEEERYEEIGKLRNTRESDFEKWLLDSDEYIKFESPIKWESSSKLDNSILGITKTNVNAGRPDYFIPIDESVQSQKTDLQISNEEKLIKGIIHSDLCMVESALESGTIEKNLIIGIVTYNPMFSKTRPFNAIYEALRKGNQDIISLLREYQNTGNI